MHTKKERKTLYIKMSPSKEGVVCVHKGIITKLTKYSLGVGYAKTVVGTRIVNLSSVHKSFGKNQIVLRPEHKVPDATHLLSLPIVTRLK